MSYMHPRHRLLFELLSGLFGLVRKSVSWLWRTSRDAIARVRK